MDGTAASRTPTEIIHVDDRTVACDGGDERRWATRGCSCTSRTAR